MPEHIKRILAGIGDSLPTLSTGREYPQYEGFVTDAKNMRGDWVHIGNDMRKALKSDEQRYAEDSRKYG